MTDAALHLTSHEVLALLHPAPADAAPGADGTATATATTLALLGLDPQEPAGDAVHHAGRATLLVRGLAQLRDGEVVPVQHCAVVASVLSQARDWVDLTLATPESEHVLLLADSPVGAVLLSRGPYGVYEIQPVATGPAVLELALQVATEFLTATVAGTPATAVLRRLRDGRDPVAAQLTVAPDGQWSLRHGTGPDATAANGAVAGAAVGQVQAEALTAAAAALA